MKIWYAASHTSDGRRTYHTDRTCERLQRANSINHKQHSLIEDRWDPCRVCSVDVDTNTGQDPSYHQALRDAEPGEVL